jgi:dTMP kinase
MKVKRAFFIVIEGLDGAGKTTLSRHLVRDLRKLGISTTWTTEPSNSSVGRILRRSILKGRKTSSQLEALMFAADRFLHLEHEVVPALRNGRTVVSDRYVYASLAYQGAQGLADKWIRKINRFARKPDLALYLDIPPELGLRRLKRSRSVMENIPLLRKVRRNYLKLVRSGELTLVDANRPIAVVREEILRKVIRRRT